MGIFQKPSNQTKALGESLGLRSVLSNTAPEGVIMFRLPEKNFNTKSILIVNPGEQAIFVRNGTIVSVIKDAGTHKLTTSNYPFLSSLRNILTSGENAYTCQVYFVRTVTSKEIKFGCGLQVRDPVLRFKTDLGVQGSFRIRILDGGIFLANLFESGSEKITPEDLQDYFKDEIRKLTKSTLAQEIESRSKEVLGIEQELDSLSEKVRPRLNTSLAEYGLRVERFNISDIRIKEDETRVKVEGVFANSQAIDLVGGDRYRAIRELDILEKAVSNENNGVASAAAGAGIGLQTGRAIGDSLSKSAGMPEGKPPVESGTTFCPKCGNSVGQEDKFCRACGNNLR